MMQFTTHSRSVVAVLVGIASTVAFAVAARTDDPMGYAQSQSKIYAEGDSNDSSGWDGCSVGPSGANVLAIDCAGVRSMLVHGGEMVTTPFTCTYVFEPTTGSGSLWDVTEEVCTGD